MTGQQIFKGWLGATLVAFLFPPAGFLAGSADNIITVFHGRWAWIGHDFSGRDCVHFPMLIVELLLIAVAAFALARIHKGHEQTPS